VFNAKKAELERLHAADTRTAQLKVEEKLLFHGCSSQTVKSICEQNFDWRRAGENAGRKYGHGSYFALNSSYSHHFSLPDDKGVRYMFVAKVLVGLACEGHAEMRYLPKCQGSIQFDTAVDRFSNASIFVKFDSTECYPAYLIQYSAS
jgi:hypothetical protein